MSTTITAILADKSIKPKEKTAALSQLLLDGSLSTDALIRFATAAKDPAKATCVEALEFATKEHPAIADKACLAFAVEALTSKASRVKWEAGKVIGNIAHLFPKQLDGAIKNLLVNTEDEGTVVRWSAAFALGEIAKLKTPINKTLLPALEAITKREEKNSIRKIYLAALKSL